MKDLVVVWLVWQLDEPLEPIYENNGFTAPDPTHDEITGYKQCECERGEE